MAAVLAAFVTAQAATPPALAADVIAVGDGSTVAFEVEGGNGRMRVPFLAQPISRSGHVAVAADATTAYVLGSVAYSFAAGGYVQPIYKHDLRTGQALGQLDVTRAGSSDALSDLTVLNGKLYVASAPAYRQAAIHEVASSGALTVRFGRTFPASDTVSSPMLAADAANGRLVLSTAGVNTTSPGRHLLIDAGDWGVRGEAAASATAGMIRADSSAQADGRLLLQKGPFPASDAQLHDLPAFAPGTSVAGRSVPGSTFTSGIPRSRSDEVVVPYDASQPPLASVVSVITKGPIYPLLRRAPFAGERDMMLDNWLLPDGMTATEAGASQLDWTSAPGATVDVALAPRGPLVADESGRVRLATVKLGVEPAGLARGVYELQASCTLDATLAPVIGGEPEPQPRVFAAATGTSVVVSSLRFAVDPASDNIVGNGDFELLDHGWGPGATSVDSVPSGPRRALRLTAFSGYPKEVSQALELPTPDAPMRLEFDYRVYDFPSTTETMNLLVTIDGIPVADLRGITVTADYQHFDAILTDPALRGRHWAEFRIRGSVASGSSAWGYVDDVRLTAVPEPASAGLLATLALALLGRRRRRR